MSDFHGARLTENCLILPAGRPNEAASLRLPIGMTIAADWLDDGKTCRDPELQAYYDEDIIVLRIQARQGRVYKTLCAAVGSDGLLQPYGLWPTTFVQWRDDDMRWPVQRTGQDTGTTMPALPSDHQIEGYPI